MTKKPVMFQEYLASVYPVDHHPHTSSVAFIFCCDNADANYFTAIQISITRSEGYAEGVRVSLYSQKKELACWLEKCQLDLENETQSAMHFQIQGTFSYH